MDGVNGQGIILNAGLLFAGSAENQLEQQKAAARGYETSPTAGDFPVQGDLELEMAVDVRAHEGGHEANQALTEALLRQRIAEQRQQLREMREAFDLRHPVDEYQSTPGLPNQTTATSSYPEGFNFAVQLTADWQLPERIESYLVTVPVGTTLAVMKLGDRYINVYNGAATTAAQTFSNTGLGIILHEDDDRLLLLAGTLTAGPTHFELMGFAHEIWGNA